MESNNDKFRKAWLLLEQKGLTSNEILLVRNGISCKDDSVYPFIQVKWNKGKLEYYHSKHKEIENLGFQTENEVILANAIYENVKDNFNWNEFVGMLKFVFRMLMIKSAWVE